MEADVSCHFHESESNAQLCHSMWLKGIRISITREANHLFDCLYILELSLLFSIQKTANLMKGENKLVGGSRPALGRGLSSCLFP